MKNDDVQQSGGLVPSPSPAPGNSGMVDAKNGPQRRSAPMKRTSERPTAEQLTPKPIGDTAQIESELRGAIAPVLQEIRGEERAIASSVVSNLVPRIIGAYSAGSEQRIANDVKEIVGEVAIESLETFSASFTTSEALVNDLADRLFAEYCPV